MKRKRGIYMNIYIAACNALPTALIVAKNKEEAEKIAIQGAKKDLGECDLDFEAYEINDYMSDCDEPDLFGWIVKKGGNYLN